MALPLLCLLQVLVVGVYQTTLSEPDMVRMMAGMVYGGITGDHLMAGYHYGSAFSFGFYQVLYQLLPNAALHDPDRVATTINQMGAVSGFLLALATCLMLDKFTTAKVALFCAIAFLFNPLLMPLLASGHPIVAAFAFMLFACTLLLHAVENRSGPRFVLLLGLAMLCMFASLTLRAEIALSFPFLAVSYWAKLPLPWRQRIKPTLLICILPIIAFVTFLICQKPYVEHDGGAGKSLAIYFASFVSPKHIASGLGVLLLAMGFLLPLALLGGFFIWKRGNAPQDAEPTTTTGAAAASTSRARWPKNWPLVLATLILILPPILFWLPNPTPARHFVIGILGLYLLLGQFLAQRLRSMKHAAMLGLMLAVGNQVVAELARPAIEKVYPWSYAQEAPRRASQRVPLGMYPLNQFANKAAEANYRQEAIKLAAKNPDKLIILADNQYYIIAHLLANDPKLRITNVKVGPFEALLMSKPGRAIYLVEKVSYWPRDVLAEIAALPEFAQLPFFVQKATVTRYDKTSAVAGRDFGLK